MTLVKRIIEVNDAITDEVIQKEVFVETKTEVKEIVWSKDLLESQIAQKQNLIENTQAEIDLLQQKLSDIIALESKPK